MKLKYAAPPGLSPDLAAKLEKALWLIPYDISLTGLPCDGWLGVTADSLLTFADNSLLATEPLTDLRDYKVEVYVGCGMLLASRDGKEQAICRFTQKHFKTMSELALILNAGQAAPVDSPEENLEDQACPICGRPYMEGTTVCPFCIKKSKILKKVLTYSKPYNKIFLISAGLLIVSSIFRLFVPYIYRQIVDGYLMPRNPDIAGLIRWVVLAFVLYAAEGGLYIWSSRINNRAGSGFANELRTQAYAKVQLLSLASISRKSSGDLLNRITSETRHIMEFVSDHGRWAIEQMFMFIGVTVILFIVNWRLALMAMAPVPIAVVSGWAFQKMIRRRYEKQWRMRTRATSVLHDIISGIRVIKTFGTEKLEVLKFRRVSRDYAVTCTSNEKTWALLFPLIGFSVSLGEFLVLYFGGYQILGGEIQLGELVQFTSYSVILYGPLRWLASIPRWFADASTSAAKIFEILDEEPDVKDRENARQLEIHGGITFDDVTFGYKSYEPVLKNINLDIKPGEMIGIVGHSGVGKSTLINLIMRLYDVDHGAIRIDGVDIREIAQKSLRTRIGVVFQETFLFAGTIYENIEYAKPGASPEEVFAAAKIAHAHEFIIVLPDAYNTIVGEHGYSLSAGERQRVAIARAVLHNPAILILDEATASLDTETESLIQDGLMQLVKGRTTVAIAHRLSTLRHADRLIVLEKGRMAESGTHTELMTKKGIYYRLVMAQRQTTKMADAVEVSVAATTEVSAEASTEISTEVSAEASQT